MLPVQIPPESAAPASRWQCGTEPRAAFRKGATAGSTYPDFVVLSLNVGLFPVVSNTTPLLAAEEETKFADGNP
jgi:hypothetical protein